MISIEQNLDFLSPLGREMADALSQRYPVFSIIEKWSRDVLCDGFFRQEFPNGVDLAMIDGDHTYDGCSFDLHGIAPYVRVGGTIVIDDYCSGPPNGIVFTDVNRSVNDFLKLFGAKFAHTAWNNGGKGFCFMSRIAQ
jgi:hypothetical protein